MKQILKRNFGEPLERVCAALKIVAEKFPDDVFLCPVHLNPQVQATMHRFLDGIANVVLVQPMAYPEFVWLMDRCTLLLSDSGGVQEEAPSLRKPVLVLRECTERPEAVEAGAAELVGTSVEQIVAAASRLLTDEAEYQRRQIDRSPFGDGCSAPRIASLIAAVNRARSAS